MIDEQLSERERSVAVLLAYGYRNTDVARELKVSLRTAEADRARLMRKLGLNRRSELVRWALDQRLFGGAGNPQSASAAATIPPDLA
jgi:DNA-binding NarL/FixJ family response regulator